MTWRERGRPFILTNSKFAALSAQTGLGPVCPLEFYSIDPGFLTPESYSIGRGLVLSAEFQIGKGHLVTGDHREQHIGQKGDNNQPLLDGRGNRLQAFDLSERVDGARAHSGNCAG